MTFASLAQRASTFAINNSPTILTSIGVVGAITTAYLTGKASFEAADIIRLKEAADDDRGVVVGDPKEVLKERIQLVWRLYIPAGTMLVATTACIIGANQVGSRRAAGLAAAYTISERTFEEYKAKVIEKLGERKEGAIHDEIAQDRVNETYLDDIKLTGLDEGELCYDVFSDRYFRGTVEGIRGSENDFNHNLIHNGYGTLAEFYGYLGMSAPPYSEQIGWNSDRLLDIRFSTVLAAGDKPCITISFKNEPLPEYGRFH